MAGETHATSFAPSDRRKDSLNTGELSAGKPDDCLAAERIVGATQLSKAVAAPSRQLGLQRRTEFVDMLVNSYSGRLSLPGCRVPHALWWP